ncbi:TPA: dUTP diphosphatase [Streptococcus suis]
MARGFEFAEGLGKEHTPILPERATAKSAGYDFFASRSYAIPPNEIALIPTGIKAYMEEDEALMLYNRSSNPLKNGLTLANGVGVVDADYYNNPQNDGHIMFMFRNDTEEYIVIDRGQKIGQGVFTKFLLIDNETAPKEQRCGGLGSTGK